DPCGHTARQGFGSPTMNAARWMGALCAAMTAIAFVIILAPIVVVVVAAFSPTDFFVFPPPRLSLRWFEEFFRLDNLRSAFLLSVRLALAAATIAAVL